ncbi:hypothetical protein D3I60_17265 [Brevibacterium permense]|nr:hypothetical protein [Brevibacterium permense]
MAPRKLRRNGEHCAREAEQERDDLYQAATWRLSFVVSTVTPQVFIAWKAVRQLFGGVILPAASVVRLCFAGSSHLRV